MRLHRDREVARRLVAEGGHAITVTRRDAAAAQAIATELGVDGMRAQSLGVTWPVAHPSCPPATDLRRVCLAPPGAEPAAEIARLVRAACGALDFYVSSTGVYGARRRRVESDEDWPLARSRAKARPRASADPGRATGRARSRCVPPAFHGPGRRLVDRLRAGTYRIIGDGRAARQPHSRRRSRAARSSTRGDPRTHVTTGAVNIADDAPDPIGIVADTLAARGSACPHRRASRIRDGVEIRRSPACSLADRKISRNADEARAPSRCGTQSWRDPAGAGSGNEPTRSASTTKSPAPMRSRAEIIGVAIGTSSRSCARRAFGRPNERRADLRARCGPVGSSHWSVLRRAGRAHASGPAMPPMLRERRSGYRRRSAQNQRPRLPAQPSRAPSAAATMMHASPWRALGRCP